MIRDDYLNLVTSEHRQKPNFIAMISFMADLMIRIQNVAAEMLPDFDLDIAVGKQLDTIGKWVGISRNVAIPIPNVYFSWNADASLGWEFGTWQGNLAPVELSVLPDDAYRTLIRAKIAANKWDGTTDGAYTIWDEIFPNFTILIQDNQDMTYALGLVGGTVDTLTLALLVGGYIPLKPEGVRVSEYYVSVDSNLAFGWDVESVALGGWDEASWLREITP